MEIVNDMQKGENGRLQGENGMVVIYK
jgi:hypothetical protein